MERQPSDRIPADLLEGFSPPAETGVAAELSPPMQGGWSNWRRRSRPWITLGAGAVPITLLLSQRGLISSSFGVLGHLRWMWLLVALPLEWASMDSLARMQRRLLTAGQTQVRSFPLVATVYAGNAISATVPLAGPQMGTVFAFRRFKQLGMDAAVVVWTLAVAGLISSLAAALLLTLGALLTGNDVVAATGATGATVAVGILVLATAAVRRPALPPALKSPAAWILTYARRRVSQLGGDPEASTAGLAARLRSMHLSPSSWAIVALVAVLNWLADTGVLAVSLAAVGGPIPWRGLLLAYGIGTAAGRLSITPGGLGVTELALALSLMGVGVRHPLAFAAVLVYRLVSFWLVVSVGWLAFFLVRHAATNPTPSVRSHWSRQEHLHLPVKVADLQPWQGTGRRRQLGNQEMTG